MPFLYVRFRMCVYLWVSKSAETGPCESSFLDHILKGCCENVTAGFKLC